LNLGGSFTVTVRQCVGSCTTTTERHLIWTIGGWDTLLIDADTMSGRWAQNVTAPGESGNAYMEMELPPGPWAGDLPPMRRAPTNALRSCLSIKVPSSSVSRAER
jgi:hypothetical protein